MTGADTKASDDGICSGRIGSARERLLIPVDMQDILPISKNNGSKGPKNQVLDIPPGK